MANTSKDEMVLPTNCETENTKNKKYIMIAVGLVLITLIAGIVFWTVDNYNKSRFIVPEFEATAVQGVPENVDDDRGFSKLSVAGVYEVGICGSLVNENGKCEIDLTNYESNDTWISIIILDEKGSYLGETGVIKPGEYVKYVNINTKKLSSGDETKINAKVRGYEPETYYSKGSVNLNMAIKN